jgi:oxygen-independent coproporphyrinogen-3 oxidase
MKLGHLESAYFQRKFGVDVERRFEAPLQNLKDRGLLATDHGKLLLNREGLLQVDRLLHDFFLPQHRTARYA